MDFTECLLVWESAIYAPSVLVVMVRVGLFNLLNWLLERLADLLSVKTTGISSSALLDRCRLSFALLRSAIMAD